VKTVCSAFFEPKETHAAKQFFSFRFCGGGLVGLIKFKGLSLLKEKYNKMQIKRYARCIIL
jgi:hypothetical protein